MKRFAVGMAVGYVLGARAGEARYQQITAAWHKVLDSQLIGRLEEQAWPQVAELGRGWVQSFRDRLEPNATDDDEDEDDEPTDEFDDDEYEPDEPRDDVADDESSDDDEPRDESEDDDEPRDEAEDDDEPRDEAEDDDEPRDEAEDDDEPRDEAEDNESADDEFGSDTTRGERDQDGSDSSGPGASKHRLSGFLSAALERGKVA